MRQVTGLLLILLLFPLLYVIQQGIVKEWNDSKQLQDSMHNTIALTEPFVPIPISMTDRDGRVFAEEYVEWRQPLTLDEIPLFARDLFLTSEDKGFFEHRGYDIAAIFRAFAVNAVNDDLQQGGSTITQQVVRMRFLTNEKTYERKFKELLYAAELEKHASKEEILEMYMNEMFFGNQAYGIGAAATFYFSRPISELTHAELAFLAAIPNNPSRYDPLKHFDKTKKRQELLLSVLANNDIISAEEATALQQEPIQLHVKRKANEHTMYSSYVLAELEKLIGRVEGFEHKIRQAKTDDEKQLHKDALKRRTAEVMTSGIQIETALHSKKQRSDEARMSALVTPKDLQAGAVVIDNVTKEIVSLYGGKDFQKGDFNRAYRAIRQPGSAMKPLLVYAPYLESGPYNERTPIDSSAICIGAYCPQNIGGYTYGTTTLKEAFRHSHNTAAVRLLRKVGIEKAFGYLQPFQFEHITKADYTYPAALGGFQVGVTPLELASAYSSFVDGTYVEPHAIRTVKSRSGDILYRWEEQPVEVWSPSTTATIRTLLEDVVVNGTGKGITYRTTYTGAKTGTTDRYKDLWVAGLNDAYTTAVWIGFDKPASIEKYSKVKIHLQAFNALSSESHP
ncbi:transglycosylase domain-containing protein [Sporosarcina saromensis]|uniref:Transglycosylase domain-containing protein n=1 Tax=Sporosarcina saromensis TaxID=359365 RepID=A0ABU4G9C9_9BACL|nr:transglycosylase domain-containing protein [Sporosarcina saromensis]MDW0113568.1 transglycosylase domain-containing protein [Sporosarcina saromensis]